MSSELDLMADEMYRQMNDPQCDKFPGERLHDIQVKLGRCNTKCREEFHPILEKPYPPSEEFEPDIPDFPEEFNYFNRSVELQNGGPLSPELLQDPDFPDILNQIESFLAKPLDLDVAAVAGGSERKGRRARRELASARRKVDSKPNRLGPHGTWCNEETEGGGTNQTQTSVQRENTAVALQRQDTLTD